MRLWRQNLVSRVIDGFPPAMKIPLLISRNGSIYCSAATISSGSQADAATSIAHTATPPPPLPTDRFLTVSHTRSLVRRGKDLAIVVRDGLYQHSPILDVFDTRSQLTLLRQCWGRRATLTTPGDRSRGLRSSPTTVPTKEEQGRDTKWSLGGEGGHTASDGHDWPALAPDLVY